MTAAETPATTRARPAAESLVIAGFTPFSTVDWPGKLAATVFLQGCPWTCTYCQNPDLIDPRTAGAVPWSRVASTLKRRQGLLDAVVFSGGEPTRQGAVVDAIERVRQWDYQVALHTAGSYPDRLRDILPLVDWVALDIKAPRDRYKAIVGSDAGGERAWRSLEHVIESGVDYEIRTTVDPLHMTRADVARIVTTIAKMGGSPPVLQEVRSQGTKPAYAARLGVLSLDSVVPPNVLPHLHRRYATIDR